MWGRTVTTVAAVALATAIIGSPRFASAQDAACPGLSLADSETLCPAGNAWIHRLEFVSWAGSSPNLSGNDVVKLGSYAGLLAACVNGSLYFIRDATAGTYNAQLQSDSAVCFEAGDDNVEVIASGSSATCGTVTLNAFNYDSYILILYGQAGRDRITGGHGIDAICGGSDGDTLEGRSGSDILYGISGTDHLYGGSGLDFVYGGSGSDRCYGGNYDGYDDYVFGESGNLDCIEDHGATTSANASCNYNNWTISEYYSGYTSTPANCTIGIIGCNSY